MPTGTEQWPRYSWKDPEDRRQMILLGIVWQLGSASTTQAAADMVAADPSLINEKTPQDVLDYIAEKKGDEDDGWA